MTLDFALEALSKILAVLPTTLLLFIFSVLLGLVFALIVLWMRMSSNGLLSGIAKTYIFIFRGTPLLIQIFLIFYGLAQFQFMKESWFWLVLKNRIASAVFVMALCTAAYQAEILRGGCDRHRGKQKENEGFFHALVNSLFPRDIARPRGISENFGDVSSSAKPSRRACLARCTCLPRH